MGCGCSFNLCVSDSLRIGNLGVWFVDTLCDCPTEVGGSGAVVSEVTDAATSSPRSCTQVGQLYGCQTPMAASF